MQSQASIDHTEPIVLPEPTQMPPRIPLRPIPPHAVSLPWESDSPDYYYRAFQVTEDVSRSELRRFDVLTVECRPVHDYDLSRRGDLVVVSVGEAFYAAHAGYTVRRNDQVVGGVIRVSREVVHGAMGLPAMVADPAALTVAEAQLEALSAVGRGHEEDEATRLVDAPWGPAQPRCAEAA